MSVPDESSGGLKAFLMNQMRVIEASDNQGADSDFLRNSPDRGDDDSPANHASHRFGAYDPNESDRAMSAHASVPAQQQDDDDSHESVHEAATSGEDPLQAGGEPDPELDRVFRAVGGFEEANKIEDGKGKRVARPKNKSVWKSIGGGISRFAKGIGGLVKNVSGYNLIRHGLIGANWNRGQMKRNRAKLNEATREYDEFMNPNDLASRRAEMGDEAFEVRRSELSTAKNQADSKHDKSLQALVDNRKHYSGFHMASNFKRAFSDGEIAPNQKGSFNKFLTNGLPRYDMPRMRL